MDGGSGNYFYPADQVTNKALRLKGAYIVSERTKTPRGYIYIYMYETD